MSLIQVEKLNEKKTLKSKRISVSSLQPLIYYSVDVRERKWKSFCIQWLFEYHQNTGNPAKPESFRIEPKLRVGNLVLVKYSRGVCHSMKIKCPAKMLISMFIFSWIGYCVHLVRYTHGCNVASIFFFFELGKLFSAFSGRGRDEGVSDSYWPYFLFDVITMPLDCLNDIRYSILVVAEQRTNKLIFFLSFRN